MLTLPRLIVTVTWMASGVVLCSLLGRKWGGAGCVLGFLTGISGAFLLTWLLLASRNLLLMPFPKCRRGKCQSYRDYVWKRGTIFGWETGGRYRYRCKCGDEYLRDGNRFQQVMSDGTTVSYKKYQRGQWVDDATEPHN